MKPDPNDALIVRWLAIAGALGAAIAAAIVRPPVLASRVDPGAAWAVGAAAGRVSATAASAIARTPKRAYRVVIIGSPKGKRATPPATPESSCHPEA